MRAINSQFMRELDRRTIEEYGVPGEVLMERAGVGVADAVENIIRLSGRNDMSVIVVAGHGNNGGDAFVVARCLYERGYSVDVFLAGFVDGVKGDARLHMDRMLAAGIKVKELIDEGEWRELLDRHQSGGGIIVDGVLGTGICGSVRDLPAMAIRYINLLGARNIVVSIDVPSGLDADSGVACGDAVMADKTVAIGLPKAGFLEQVASDYVGTVDVVDIGIPHELMAGLPDGGIELMTSSDVAPLMGRRKHCSHKGTYGHVLIIGGARGYSGSVALAGMAALRSGAGLVTILVPERVCGIVAGMVPEAMVHPAAETDDGSLAAGCLEKWGRDRTDFDAILIGPGMTRHGDSGLLVRQVLRESKVPVVLDADGINVCAGDMDVFSGLQCPVIMTPHPGELAGLMGCTAADVQADRVDCAVKAAERSGAVIVLKGAGTIVCSNKRHISLNRTGNAGMGAGGSGDVLGGVVSALVAGGIMPYNAACAGVFVHGLAGDISAFAGSQTGLTAGDLARSLPHAFRIVCGR